MTPSRIFYSKPSITDLEVAYATDAARYGWGSRCYEYIGKFERLFAEHLGVAYAIATSSCTGALHMGLSALGIGPGDEVIVPDTTWIASVTPVTYLGAKPVFVDVEPDSWCIDPQKVEVAITPRTKAIIGVHLYGNLFDVERLLSIGERYSLPVIEDAAEAIGSVYLGRRAGSMGRFGTFSFHGSKTLTTGEGGMFVTNDTELYEKVLTLSNHGRAKGQPKQFWSDEIGFKYKISNVQAAIGCAQVERIEELLDKKRYILAKYREQLSSCVGVSVNPEPEGTVNGAWMPTALFSPETGITREMLLSAFQAENIDARVFFYPVSSFPMFVDQPGNAVAWDLPNRAINLPSYHELTDEEIGRVVGVIRRLLDEAQR